MQAQDATAARADALADAVRIRAVAEREAAELLADAKRRADAFAEARIARIRELSDRLISAAEGLDRRFTGVAEVQRQLDELVTALGAAAERAAAEQHPADRTPRFEPAEPPPGAQPVRSAPGSAVVEVVPDTRPQPSRRAVP